MSAIRIDEPCNEKWNEMTTTERGAFCQKCAIDVYDFSKLSLNGIKQILKDNNGAHLCGRFEKNQLTELNNEFEIWKHNQPKSFQSRFVFALLLVFGVTLFSCETEDSKTIGQLNTIELKSALFEPDKTIADQLFYSMDAIIAHEMIPQLKLTDEIIEYHTMGELTYEVMETYNQESYLGMIAGGPRMDVEYLEYLNHTIDTSSSTTLPDPVISVYNPFETKLYPNPTRDEANFSIHIMEPAMVLIEVYSMTGQKIAELHNGNMQDGRFEFNIDLRDQPAGTYLVKVWSEKQQETMKILKVQ